MRHGEQRWVWVALVASVLCGSQARASELRAPKSIVLGSAGPFTVTLRAPTGVKPRLFTNLGVVSQPQIVGAGQWRATYTPPSSQYPQVAILLATDATGALFAWTAVQLIATPTVRIRSEPNARVTVDVAGRSFGPVKTDRRGRAAVSLRLPPGYSTATLVARDRLGNTTRKPLNLSPPPFNRALAHCPQHKSVLIVLVVDAKGGPEKNATLKLAANPGTLRPARMVAPGVYESTLAIDNPSGATEVALSARLAGSRASVSCRASLVRSEPSSIALSLDRAQHRAGQPRAVLVSATLTYPVGGVPLLRRPTFTADVGEITAVKQVAPSKFEARWRLPDALKGRTEATITAAAGEARGRATVRLRPGPAHRLSVSLPRSRFRANGRDCAPLQTHVQDQHGNRDRQTPVTYAADRGRVRSLGQDRSGVHRAVYCSPRSARAASDRITVRSGKATAVRILELTSPASRFGVSARVGLLTNLGRVLAPYAQLGVVMRSPVVSSKLLVGAQLGIYSSSDTTRSEDGREDVELDLSAVPLRLRVMYEVEAGGFGLRPGVSVGVTLATMTIGSVSSGMRELGSSRLSAGGSVEGLRALGRGRASVELGYSRVTAGAHGLSGNIAGIRITGGYEYPF